MYSNLKNGYFKYQQTDVLSLSNVEIIDRLFKALCADIERAATAIESGDVSTKGERLSRAIAIVGELQASLNFEEGGEIAERLNALYDYVIRELLFANLENNTKRLDNAKGALMPIVEAWHEITVKNKETVPLNGDGAAEQVKQIQSSL